MLQDEKIPKIIIMAENLKVPLLDSFLHISQPTGMEDKKHFTVLKSLQKAGRFDLIDIIFPF